MDGARSLEDRAARFATLGDPIRLAIVDALLTSDRAPIELRRRTGVGSNLLAHHLDVLEAAGLIVRSQSSGDGRRRYVRLRRSALVGLLPFATLTPQPVLFICTANSARSQLAAALWQQATGEQAFSAGTHPASHVHPRAVDAAARAGLDLSSATPRSLDQVVNPPKLLITVCDRAHEELGDAANRLHWSIPDPIGSRRRAAFDDAVAELRQWIDAVTNRTLEMA